MWVTVVVELLKALNSGNYLLRDVLRGHMQAVPQIDRDVTRVKERLRGMGPTLRTLTRETDGGQCVIVSPKMEVYRLYVVGDASYGTTRGVGGSHGGGPERKGPPLGSGHLQC